MAEIQAGDAPRKTLRLPQSLWARIDRVARVHGRSRNTEICGALQNYVSQEEKKIQRGT